MHKLLINIAIELISGRLAQLVRASRLHREGRQFDSVTAHHCSFLTGV